MISSPPPHLTRVSGGHWTAFDGSYNVRYLPDPYSPKAPYLVTTPKFGSASIRCATVTDALDAAIAFEGSSGSSWQ